MPARRILVVEDDPAIRRGVSDALQHAGYDVLEAADAPSAVDQAVRVPCDLVLLDLMLPGGDGLSVLEEARAARPTLPVVILTARGQEADRVRGLKLGADDYVVKPFSLAELLARVEAVLRRTPGRPVDVEEVAFPGGRADLAGRAVHLDDGTARELSTRESDLLAYLGRHPGRTVGRDELLARVWHLNPNAVHTRTVDMTVARLREKLGDDGATPRIIQTVRGKGYRFLGDA